MKKKKEKKRAISILVLISLWKNDRDESSLVRKKRTVVDRLIVLDWVWIDVVNRRIGLWIYNVVVDVSRISEERNRFTLNAWLIIEIG